MTSEELYYTLNLLVNKNNENAEIYVERENFVLLYNREALRWLADYIVNNNSSNKIDHVQNLIVRSHKLDKVSDNSSYTSYALPENFFIPVIGDFRSKTSCGIIYNWIFKPNDVNVALEDKMTRPSAAWERGVASLAEDQVVVYKQDFDIVESLFSYYKKPRAIDLVGYVNLENKQSTNVDPDINEYLCNQILDRVAAEIKREWPSTAEFQLAQTRERGY